MKTTLLLSIEPCNLFLTKPGDKLYPCFIDQATALDVSIIIKAEIITGKSTDSLKVDTTNFIRSQTNTMMDTLMAFEHQSSEKHTEKIVQEIQLIKLLRFILITMPQFHHPSQ